MIQYIYLKNVKKNSMNREILILISFLFVMFVCNGQASIKYDSIAPYSEGFAAVKQNGKWGYIDQVGKEIIPCEYTLIISTENIFIGMKRIPGWNTYDVYLFDKNGKIINTKEYKAGVFCSFKFNENLFPVFVADKYGSKHGFIDKTGKEVIPLKYEEANSFHAGMAAVKYNKKWGFIDQTGKVIIPFVYEWVVDFENDFAKVKLGNEIFYINKKGKKTDKKVEVIEDDDDEYEVIEEEND